MSIFPCEENVAEIVILRLLTGERSRSSRRGGVTFGSVGNSGAHWGRARRRSELFERRGGRGKKKGF